MIHDMQILRTVTLNMILRIDVFVFIVLVNCPRVKKVPFLRGRSTTELPMSN